jgi:hypothetical protein
VVDGEYISSLEFVTTDSCSDKTYLRLPTDLNFGTGSSTRIYMCIMADSTPPYLTGITIASGKAGKVSCPAGTTASPDLNIGASLGNIVYACMTYTSSEAAPVKIKDALAVIGINEPCPAKYQKVPGNVNDGVTGALLGVHWKHSTTLPVHANVFHCFLSLCRSPWDLHMYTE